MYRVTEYIGDYPLEAQKHWGAEFKNFLSAWQVARDIWEESVKTTKVLDPDYYVLIEIEDKRDDADWTSVAAFNISGHRDTGYVNKFHIKKFISRFEV